jgi:hypothetical protein
LKLDAYFETDRVVSVNGDVTAGRRSLRPDDIPHLSAALRHEARQLPPFGTTPHDGDRRKTTKPYLV